MITSQGVAELEAAKAARDGGGRVGSAQPAGPMCLTKKKKMCKIKFDRGLLDEIPGESKTRWRPEYMSWLTRNEVSEPKFPLEESRPVSAPFTPNTT